MNQNRDTFLDCQNLGKSIRASHTPTGDDTISWFVDLKKGLFDFLLIFPSSPASAAHYADVFHMVELVDGEELVLELGHEPEVAHGPEGLFGTS